MLVLTISSFTVLIAESITHPIHLSSSEPVLSQAAENPPRPRNTPTSTPKNNNPPTSEKSSSWGFWWWIFLLIIFSLISGHGNSRGGGGDGGSNDGCAGCACM